MRVSAQLSHSLPMLIMGKDAYVERVRSRLRKDSPFTLILSSRKKPVHFSIRIYLVEPFLYLNDRSQSLEPLAVSLPLVLLLLLALFWSAVRMIKVKIWDADCVCVDA